MSKSGIIVLCPNPAIEVTYFCKRLSLHDQVDANFRAVPGGKGTNVAKILSAMNADLVLLACVGGKLGKFYEDQLLESGIECDFIRHGSDLRISTVIYEDVCRVPTVIRSDGEAVPDDSQRRFIELVEHHISRGKIVCLSGSLPNGFSPRFVEQICRTVADQHAQILLDIAGPALLFGLPAFPFLVKINYREATAALSYDSSSQVDLKQLLTIITSRGARNVIITLGRDGWVACVEGNFVRCTIDVNPEGFDIGAGDAMLAGIAHGLASGLSWQDTLNLATRVAAASTYCRSGGEIVLNRIDDFPSSRMKAF